MMNAKDFTLFRGKTLLHEFAKLRWGVFEEHGYPGDEKFPMFYQRDTWTAEGQTTVTQPNFCINEELNGYQQVGYQYIFINHFTKEFFRLKSIPLFTESVCSSQICLYL